MNENVDNFDEGSEGMENTLRMKKPMNENIESGNEKELELEFTPFDKMVILLYKLASTIHATAVIHSVWL